MTRPELASWPDVRPGQVWADNDKRSAGRRVRVERVDERFAYVVDAATGKRRSRIAIERMRPTSTGYRLVEDVPR